MKRAAFALAALVGGASGAQAQDAPREPVRTRVALGPQLVPKFPGSDTMVVRPFVDVARGRGDTPFAFEAADESFGFPVLRSGGFEVGPAIGFEGARKTRDARGLPSVGFTVEPGAFVQYSFAAPVRVRAELRQGVGGHKGLIGVIGADYVARDGDDWLFAIGPRVTISNGRYQRAWFGLPAGNGANLPAFRPDGGVHAVGATAGYLKQFDRRWGIYAYGKYDRLVDDAARSPYVRRDGSRDQWSGGVALTYTFGRGVD